MHPASSKPSRSNIQVQIWTASTLQKAFILAGLAPRVLDRHGRLFDSVPVPAPINRPDAPTRPTTNCLLWVGGKYPSGYGKVYSGEDGKHNVVHIVSSRLSIGRKDFSRDPNLDLGHLCEVRHCAHPNHTRLISHQSNMREGKNRIWPDEILSKAGSLDCICGTPMVSGVAIRKNKSWRWRFTCLPCNAAYFRYRYALHQGRKSAWPGRTGKITTTMSTLDEAIAQHYHQHRTIRNGEK